MISLLIPTKNRPKDLKKAIRSLLFQTIMPDEIIVIDQSTDDKSKNFFLKTFRDIKNVKYKYIHDQKINGLVEAKSVGVKNATKDIICFIEDDVFLQNDYIEQIKKGFELKHDMVGCSGIVTNSNENNLFYHYIFNFFHLGIFQDNRPILFSKSHNDNINYFTPSNKLSGGISAWRKEVFEKIQFDIKNNFHMLEDIDFSFRVYKFFKGGLYINSKMKLKHYSSPVNRDILFYRYKKKIIEYFLFFKKNSSSFIDFVNFGWLLFGMFLESVYICIIDKSFDPIGGYVAGFKDGCKTKIIK